MKMQLVPFGRVGKAKGLKGHVYLDLFNVDSNLIFELGELWLGESEESAKVKKVVSIDSHNGRSILQFQNIQDRESAESLTGKKIYIRRDSLPEIKENEFYHFDLIGAKVQSAQGQLLGTLKSIVPTPSNNIFVVENNGKENLYPDIPGVVKEVDVDHRVLVLDLPEEINAF